MTKAISKSGTDFTEGRLFKKFVLFAIPIILANILQQLFTVADSIVIGQFSGSNSLGSITACTPIINLTINALVGIAVGVNVVVAQAIGRKQDESAHRAVHSSMLFALIAGVLVGVLGFLISNQLASLLGVSDVLKKNTATYLGVYFLGTPAVMVYNFGASVLRAKGDSKRPLYFLLLSGVLNVGLNLLFVIVFHMDVLGVALATVISQTVSAVLVVICMMRETDCTKLEIKKLRFHKKELSSVLKTGVPSMLNGIIFNISNLIVHISVNSLGEIATNGNGIASNVENFTYLAMNSVYTTTLTVVGQNYGANNYDRIKKAIKIGLSSVVVVGVVLSAITFLLRRQLCGLFVSGNDEETLAAIEFASSRMVFILATYWLCGMQEVFVAGTRGLGYSTLSTVISLIFACCFRIVWIYTAYSAVKTNAMLFLTYPISWVLLVISQGILFAVLYKKLKKKSRMAIEGINQIQ